MIPRRNRARVKAVLKGNPKTLRTSSVVWYIAASDMPHYAVIVSKKVAKSAVKRNKIRRWYQYALRQLITESISIVCRITQTPQNYKEVQNTVAELAGNL